MIVLSPGNYLRLAKGEGASNVLLWVAYRVVNIVKSPWFDLTLLTLIYSLIKERKTLREYIRRNSFLCQVYLFGIMFVFVLCVPGRGQYQTDIFSLMILASFLPEILFKRTLHEFRPKIKWILTLGLITVGMQWLIISECKQQREIYDDMITAYLLDDSGVVMAEQSEVRIPLFSPWVRCWETEMNPEDEFDAYRRRLMKYYYSHPEGKPLVTLNRMEYKALKEGILFADQRNRIDGNAGFYHKEGMEHMVALTEEGDSSDSFVVENDLKNIENERGLKGILNKIRKNPKKEDLSVMKIEVDKRLYYIAKFHRKYPIEKVDRNKDSILQ